MNFYMIIISKFTMLSYQKWNRHTWNTINDFSNVFNEKFQNETFNGPVSLTLFNYLFY